MNLKLVNCIHSAEDDRHESNQILYIYPGMLIKEGLA